MSFYVTTPIYYVNDKPHIGHAYTTILADVLARYHRLYGEDVFFLTGTDEHGQKVQSAAKARDKSPQDHCDEMVQHYKEIWKELNISHDFFIRTTDDFHKQGVQAALQELFDKGEIYESTYEGWYSVSEEIFYNEDDLVDGKSPFGKEVVKIQEKNYFFKMSKYQQRLIDHIEQNPKFIQPEGKKSEVLGFLRKPLNDLCISRPKSRLEWGIELPFDNDFVTYVWFDALLNYATGVGYKQTDEKAKLFDRYWPHVIHLMGKDILTTHSVYWPTMLMALDVKLPETVFAHGWWLTASNQKMSKSEGPVTGPLEMKDIVGVDPLRYFLIRAMNPANDGQFSPELVIDRVNSELANNLGNLINRVTGLAAKYFDSTIPEIFGCFAQSAEIEKAAIALAPEVKSFIEQIAPHKIADVVVDLLSKTNRFLDETAPWKTLKDGQLKEGGESLRVALEAVRISAIFLYPIMPTKALEILERIGWSNAPDVADTTTFKLLPTGGKVVKGDAIFPRVEG